MVKKLRELRYEYRVYRKRLLPEKMKREQEPLGKFKAVNNGPAILPEQALANDVKVFTGYICAAAP